MMSELGGPWRAFAMLGAATLALVIVDIVSSAVEGSLLSYPPLAQLELVVALLSAAPLLALNQRFYVRVIRADPAPLSRGRLWAYQLLAHWLAAFAAVLGGLPGLFLAHSENALGVFAATCAATFLAVRWLAGGNRAWLTVWIAASLFAMTPVWGYLGFALFF